MLPSSTSPKTNLSQIQERLEKLGTFKRDILNDNHSGCLSRTNLTSNNELHPKNPITFVFNVEVSPHVCSLCHGFGHLLISFPYRSNQIKV
jgi:hypothetical protein